MSTAFQTDAFQSNAFQILGEGGFVPPVVVTGGGGFAQGGGKRHLPKLEELEVFCRLEKRRPGQSIIECLRELDEPEKVEAVLEEAVAEIAAIRRQDTTLQRQEFRSQIAKMRQELATVQGFLREQREQQRVREEDDEDDDMFLMGML